ncbi:MAG: phosphonate transport system permease protein [Thiomicrorhabdus sp.]|nr:MAG: phosphonate transport system permease protein [Thiomicrorhabdus sp.]
MSQQYQKILKQASEQRRRLVIQLTVVLGLLLLCSYYVGLFDIARLADGLPSLWLIAQEGFPPNFSDWQSWLKPLFDTVAMSIVGTALAFTVALPLGILAARNTSPHPIIYQLVRAILNILRAIPELIMGILFVAAVGFGVLPGVLALAFHSIGMVGKFVAESIEHADNGPIEAVRSTGASPFQVITHAVLPQVTSKIIDLGLYRWEYNFRASTVLGMVGAGGIGFELMSSLRLMHYDEVAALLLIILLMVTLVDSVGGFLRLRFK